ncbi:folate-binding protein [Trueperella pyogenes]|uniref:CAF17-like 4Fe-4S cluster assembly/insertion protein YgfZ n=1 Tax=Trueperella pyogenes TaxID=1661 RepID=UPI000F84F77B|nr:folate-binding protein YgfZ [Trueperella pyogenes]AZR02822.1 folate-binding protein [Trueperella pyogenes]
MKSAEFPGAVVDEGHGVPAHYGNPFAEEQKLVAGRAFTDLSFMEVVTVGGPDRAAWLHSLTTRDFLHLPTGESSEVLLLDPNGHIQTAAGVVDDGERTWFLLDRGQAQPFADFLDSMIFRMRVEIARPEAQVFGLFVPDGVPAAISALADVVWLDPWPRTAQGGAHYGVVDADHPARSSARALAVVRPGQPVIETFLAEGFEPAGLQAWEAKRVTDWRPRPNTEVVERALPHELDWLRTAVHLNKGCYRGQETVAKLVNLGKPPRRLTYLYLEGPEGDLPAAGTEVRLGEKVVGQVTSVARDYEAGPVALALVKRNTATDAELSVGDFIAAQVPIVAREGKSSASPSQRPGAGLRPRRG